MQKLCKKGKKQLLVYYAWLLCCPLSLQPLTGGSTTEEMFLGHTCMIKVGLYCWPHLSACVFGFRSCLPLGCGTFLGDLWKSTCRIWTREHTAVIFEDRLSNDSTCSTHTHTHTHTHTQANQTEAWLGVFSHTCIITWIRQRSGNNFTLDCMVDFVWVHMYTNWWMWCRGFQELTLEFSFLLQMNQMNKLYKYTFVRVPLYN